MTDKELAKRLGELSDAFMEMCTGRDCRGCEMEAFAREGVCSSAWIWKRMKEDEAAQVRSYSDEEAGATPNESPATADKMEAVQLPAWCKVGAWVLMNNNLNQIVNVNGDPYYPLTVKDIHGGQSFAHPRIMCPVRFRPYTYVEAKGLLGKVMEYRVRSECSFVCNSMLISRVSFHPDSGEVFIHSCSFSDWWGYEPTIDGVPIGVPEVDEEAMKEVKHD